MLFSKSKFLNIESYSGGKLKKMHSIENNMRH